MGTACRRVLLLLFLFLFVVLAAASAGAAGDNGMAWIPVARPTCRGTMGECMGGEEDMESETARRILGDSSGSNGYISYEALKRDSVPCSLRGNSYYNCKPDATSGDPYTRGCSAITHCRS